MIRLLKKIERKRSEKMRVTVKRLLKMGLNKEQIKKMLKIEEERYQKLYNSGAPVASENIAKKIDYVLKGGSIEDFEFANVFDKIFELNKIETLEIGIKQKADLIREFPEFIQYIELKRITDQITLLNKKKVDLEGKMKEINEEISSFELKMGLMKGEKKIKEEVKHQKDIMTLIEGEDIKIYKTYVNGNLFGHIYGMKERGLEVGDLIDIANEKGINRYLINSNGVRGQQQTFKLKENILTKLEG